MPGVTEVLQQIHAARTEIAEARDQQTQGPQQLKMAQARLDRKTAALAALHDEAKTLRKAGDAKDLQIKTAEARTLELRGKLNAAGNVKEYDAIKDEIARLQGTIDAFENEGIEIMNQQDAKAAEIAAALADLEAGKADHANLKSHIDERTEKYRRRQQDGETLLASLVPKLTGDAAAFYQRTTSTKGDGGLASCAGGVCGNCASQQPPSINTNLRIGQPELCRSCGVLLYFEK